MSADLFAAFMAEENSPKGASEPAAQPTVAPGPDLFEFQSQTPAGSVLKQVQQYEDLAPLWKRNDGGDVLFDAEEARFDDDFGDFATAGKAPSDELGIDDREDAARSGDIKLKSRQDSFSALFGPGLSPTNNEILQPAQAANKTLLVQDADGLRPETWTKDRGPDTAEDDGWGDFEQTEIPAPPSLVHLSLEQSLQPQPKVEEATAGVSEDDWERFDAEAAPAGAQSPLPSIATVPKGRATSRPTTQQADTPPVLERPTNIPPPSSLLQLLSTVFQLFHKNDAEATTSKQDLASQVLIVFRTAGRIAVGRTLRWKRDTILAQSVRIGQAGKSRGMKLAVVNKSETAKEERDTEDMIQDWSNYVHEFNSIMAHAGFPPQRMRLSAKTSLKLSKGASISGSSKQCAICGLKRTERLSDVDVDVDDLFGEFWVEHWGHKDCYDFWYSYKTLLGQR